jgi:hypothetical protein
MLASSALILHRPLQLHHQQLQLDAGGATALPQLR